MEGARAIPLQNSVTSGPLGTLTTRKSKVCQTRRTSGVFASFDCVTGAYDKMRGGRVLSGGMEGGQ